MRQRTKDLCAIVQKRINSYDIERSINRIENLNVREEQVLLGILEDKSIKEIASSMGLAAKTTAKYYADVMHVLNTKTRLQCLELVVRLAEVDKKERRGKKDRREPPHCIFSIGDKRMGERRCK